MAKKKRFYNNRFYVTMTDEEKLRWTLCAGEDPLGTWIRKVVNAVTIIDYGLDDLPNMDRSFAQYIRDNPIWDVEVLRPEPSPAREGLLRERLSEHKKRNSISEVPLCEWSRLPRFACSCRTCTNRPKGSERSSAPSADDSA